MAGVFCLILPEVMRMRADNGNVMGMAFWVIYFALLVILIIAMCGTWKTYKKAGYPGWGCLIPLYNRYCVYDMAMGKGWWFILECIPLVGIVVRAFVCMRLSESFDRGVGFAFGLYFLEPVFMMILGFGEARYSGPK